MHLHKKTRQIITFRFKYNKTLEKTSIFSKEKTRLVNKFGGVIDIPVTIRSSQVFIFFQGISYTDERKLH